VTFYKYKDAVFSFSQDESTRKAIISFVIRHEKGALAQVINLLSRSQANILSLNQTAPINGIASLTITIDMADLETSPEDLIRVLQDLPAVSRTELVAVE
ncbi:ACT domain-containing protein, partial [Faecalibaculum rodentium]|uniref:ACT domain-containing protein n=1 Tax=Faecalibaculum rodentium TaxID=1702221 RepID=UPI00256F5FA6